MQHILQLRKLVLAARKPFTGRILCRSVKPLRPRLAKMGLETRAPKRGRGEAMPRGGTVGEKNEFQLVFHK